MNESLGQSSDGTEAYRGRQTIRVCYVCGRISGAEVKTRRETVVSGE